MKNRKLDGVLNEEHSNSEFSTHHAMFNVPTSGETISNIDLSLGSTNEIQSEKNTGLNDENDTVSFDDECGLSLLFNSTANVDE